MKPNELQTAFALIADFKLGRFTSNMEVSDAQIDLLRLLCGDLLPSVKFSVNELSDLIVQISSADTLWNRRAQLAIDEFYSLQEAGKACEALLCRSSFLKDCPSIWYRGIVEAI